MDQPLGRAVGNALEVREAIDVLAGGGPSDLREVVETLAAHLLVLTDSEESLERGRERAASHLANGRALETARCWIAAQGGDPAVFDGQGLPVAPTVVSVPASDSGIVQKVAAMPIAQACLLLGAGREVKGGWIDHSVGVVIEAAAGTEVDIGVPLASVHARTVEDAEKVRALIQSAFHIGAGGAGARDAILEELCEGDS
jgi:pyrimidine-nucleoside phosphorylase